jgi:hypothetical protein
MYVLCSPLKKGLGTSLLESGDRDTKLLKTPETLYTFSQAQGSKKRSMVTCGGDDDLVVPRIFSRVRLVLCVDGMYLSEPEEFPIMLV